MKKLGTLRKQNCTIELSLDTNINLIDVVKSQGIKQISHFGILPKDLNNRIALWRFDGFKGMIRTKI